MTIASASALRREAARLVEAAKAAPLDLDAIGAAAQGLAAKTGTSPESAAEILGAEIVRQIAAIAVANDASRPNFNRALRVAESAGAALADGSSPSAALVAFLRRAGRRFGRGSARAGSGFAAALPSIRDDAAGFQILDLTGEGGDRAAAALGFLSGRPDDGLSAVFALDADIDSFAAVRDAVGLDYGIEATAQLLPAMATGAADGPAMMAVFAGHRRPRRVGEMPEESCGVFRVSKVSDMMELEAAMARARGSISEFNRGEKAQVPEEAVSDELRQRRYKSLSAVGGTFTMVPRALEGATAKAHLRTAAAFAERGGIDETVMDALGCSRDELGAMLIPEQIDAVGMHIAAAERGRGFMLADQTGIGKGRSLAAMARVHLRGGEGRKVIYFTESATVNVPDVCRDLEALGMWDPATTEFLTTGSKAEVGGETKRSIPAARQAEIFESLKWPDGVSVLVTTYSKFSGKEDAPASRWIETALDRSTMIILDETHNALNPKSNTGVSVRAAIAQVEPSCVVYASGTPARDPRGIDLYEPLLPNMGAAVGGVLEGVGSGGTVAQEAFASMLAEDGVMLRRDHDLGCIEFLVDIPDDGRVAEYQKVMDDLSPIVEGMIGASLAVGEMMRTRMSETFRNLIDSGLSESAARERVNALQQYNVSIGGPLSNFARVCMNSMKVDQVVEAACRERDAGRKPLVTFHSTNGALLQEIVDAGEEERAAGGALTLKDQIRRIHDRIYRVSTVRRAETRAGRELARAEAGPNAWTDAREVSPEIRAASDEVERLIEALPCDLPVSPVDRLRERLEEEGFRVGEITGRMLCYRDGRIQRRSAAERDRRAAIDGFNGGDVDILIYNSAGATGASYHASADFADRRARSLIELETPLDIIKYVQSQGRGNRYGQVEDPRVVSVMTGLTPEMRILQQRNRKLRSLGASVDGNRAHPLLLDDVPDLLNKVGDEAAQNVLLQIPRMARRLGFTDIAERQEGERNAKAPDQNLANRVLARSIMLPAAEQEDLVQRICMEFDVIIEELDSQNANPLRPKELDGRVDVQATSVFSGMEGGEDGDLDQSAFLSPLYVSTGSWHQTEDALRAERLAEMVEECAAAHGAEGLSPVAERVRQNAPILLRTALPNGYSMDAAMRDPSAIPGAFEDRHSKLFKFADLLGYMRPGAALRFADQSDTNGSRMRVVVGLVPPSLEDHWGLPCAYKVKLVSPGMSRPETVSLSRLLWRDCSFHIGLSGGMDQKFLMEFDKKAALGRRMPVQILTGNILLAIGLAEENNFGSVALYKTMEGEVSRGIVVPPSKVNLDDLPVSVPSGPVAGDFIADIRAKSARMPAVWVWGNVSGVAIPSRHCSDIRIRAERDSVEVHLPAVTKRTRPFYASRPGLHEAMAGGAAADRRGDGVHGPPAQQRAPLPRRGRGRRGRPAENPRSHRGSSAADGRDAQGVRERRREQDSRGREGGLTPESRRGWSQSGWRGPRRWSFPPASPPPKPLDGRLRECD